MLIPRESPIQDPVNFNLAHKLACAAADRRERERGGRERRRERWRRFGNLAKLCPIAVIHLLGGMKYRQKPFTWHRLPSSLLSYAAPVASVLFPSASQSLPALSLSLSLHRDESDAGRTRRTLRAGRHRLPVPGSLQRKKEEGGGGERGVTGILGSSAHFIPPAGESWLNPSDSTAMIYGAWHA
ncbi:hypothetical protein GGR56DRAFT_643183 [Xylariaceae sp. FL0804]|nr:hypothetical protein GGR56DRAFT_643183 [Xylariaceae sp. FL0804]